MSNRSNGQLLRTSERSAFKRCRWQWQRGYVDGLKSVEERPALRFGHLVHKALELRYPPGVRRGPHPARSFERLFDEELLEYEKTWGFRVYGSEDESEWLNARELGVTMLEAFVDLYGKDEEWKVLAPEMTFKVPVYSPPHPDGGYKGIGPTGTVRRTRRKQVLFHYVGTMDLVWAHRPTSKIYINDWKTCGASTDVNRAGEDYALNDQASSYWTFGVDYGSRPGGQIEVSNREDRPIEEEVQPPAALTRTAREVRPRTGRSPPGPPDYTPVFPASAARLARIRLRSRMAESVIRLSATVRRMSSSIVPRER